MKDRPILFSGEMVRAILHGRKTQTRRVIKPQALLDRYTRVDACYRCPYGAPGDRLWVRETVRIKDQDGVNPTTYLYRADYKPSDIGYNVRYGQTEWWPSIHMPRSASRITLSITDVSVQRLQEITDAEATNEGIVKYPALNGSPDVRYGDGLHKTPTTAFHRLWDSINAKRGHSWDSNPWVWVVSFVVVS